MRTSNKFNALLQALGILALILPVAHAESLTNGGFEDTAAGVYPSGSTAIGGWTVGGTGTISLNVGPTAPDYLFSPPEGTHYLVINAGNQIPGATIFQDFATTAGQTYTISFNVGRGGPGAGDLGLRAEVSPVGGAVFASVDALAQTFAWSPDTSFSFQAPSTNTRLLFRDISTATISADVLLDNVRLVPEPSMGALLIVGAGIIGVVRKRWR